MKVVSKKWLLLNSFLFLFFGSNLLAQSYQNIVPNGSFETYTQCPTNGSEIYFAPPWTGPIANSTDYYNSCATMLNVPYYSGIGEVYPYYLPAKTGNAYIGMYNCQPYNYREYAQVKLEKKLQDGVCYYVEFYAANGQGRKYRINNTAAAFSVSEYSSTAPPPYLISIQQHITNYGNPILQDTAQWQKISGIFEGAGNEEYLILGNFKNDSNTDTVNIYPPGKMPYYGPSHSYIFIDAVSVYSLDPHGTLPWSYRDTIIKEGDSVFIGNHMGGLNFHPKWYKAEGAFIATNAGITVKPEITSKYVVQFTLCGVPHSDTVEVKVNLKNAVGINKLMELSERLKMYPIPAKDYLELELTSPTLAKDLTKIQIYNNLGSLLREEELSFENNKFILKTEDLPEGLYSLQIKSVTLGTVSKRFVISR